MIVNVLEYFLDKKEALEHGRFLISTLKPKYNVKKGTVKWKFLVDASQ